MSECYCDFYRSKKSKEDLSELIFRHLPDGDFKKIVIKPNWVKHQENPSFPMDALITSTALIITSTALIDSVIEACLKKYKNSREIIVGDVPLQSCDWDLLIKQAGIDKLINKYQTYNNPVIQFVDLRRERYSTANGFLKKSNSGNFGDAKGYREVLLDDFSFLDPISHARDKFRVSDYDPNDTTSSHHKGFHRYLISGSVLDCDLFINMPKMKTHQKSGLTGALKNIVGINGHKAYLVHFRLGSPAKGGDEFPPDVPIPIVVQARVRDFFQKRSKLLFSLLRKGWKIVREIYGIEVEGTPENLQKRFYIAGGSWYGNDTIWRMVYDLNKTILYAPREGGHLKDSPQRTYIAILDGIVSGEGNGPLQPLPIETGILAFSNDPFLLDMAMAQMMGFDYSKIPLLYNFQSFHDKTWALFDPEVVKLSIDEKELVGISSIPVLHNFLPPPGWKGHIEINPESQS